MSHSLHGVSCPKFILSSSSALSFLLDEEEMNDRSKGGDNSWVAPTKAENSSRALQRKQRVSPE